ncbi:unnamed protein product [Nezara viridula]|uniref:Uncharacterized protein n=1 Tax=Nezara viridula TaxID=85310 RepID=A0A9P0DWF1_NEZVI|nr:unnamed protein product [Nezara viridula]CAH1389231.1 unnamed protein product [Nezara viridula]
MIGGVDPKEVIQALLLHEVEQVLPQQLEEALSLSVLTSVLKSSPPEPVTVHFVKWTVEDGNSTVLVALETFSDLFHRVPPPVPLRSSFLKNGSIIVVIYCRFVGSVSVRVISSKHRIWQMMTYCDDTALLCVFDRLHVHALNDIGFLVFCRGAPARSTVDSIDSG